MMRVPQDIALSDLLTRSCELCKNIQNRFISSSNLSWIKITRKRTHDV